MLIRDVSLVNISHRAAQAQAGRLVSIRCMLDVAQVHGPMMLKTCACIGADCMEHVREDLAGS